MRKRTAAFVFLAVPWAGVLQAQVVDVEYGGLNQFRDRTSLTAVTRVHEGDTIAFTWPPAPGSARSHNVFPFNQTLSRTGTVPVPAADVMTLPPDDFQSGSVTYTSAWDPATRSRFYACTLHAATMSGVIYVYERAQEFRLQAPAAVVAGQPFSLTVTAVGSGGTTDEIYAGTVHFSSPQADAGMALPADYTFLPAAEGTHRFDNLVLTAPGTRTIEVVAVDGSVAGQVTLDVQTCLPQQSFSNSFPIVIPDPQLPGSRPTAGRARPYPSLIDVTGVTGQLTGVTVTLRGSAHQRREDVDILLVGPGGETLTILSDAGLTPPGPFPFPLPGAVTLVLSDTGTPGGTNVIRLRPTNIGGGDAFPSPAPPPPYRNPAPAGTATLTNTFAGHDPNGTWALYVVDDATLNIGAIAGWTLALDVACP